MQLNSTFQFVAHKDRAISKFSLICPYPGLPAETSIERFVTIGAYSLLRSCTIEPECIIGQHSILMEGSLVETHSILEAGSVVPPGRRIPTGELWAGNPARFVRTLTYEEKSEIPKLAVAINDLSKDHFSEFLPYSTAYLEVEKFKKSLGITIWCSLSSYLCILFVEENKISPKDKPAFRFLHLRSFCWHRVRIKWIFLDYKVDVYVITWIPRWWVVKIRQWLVISRCMFFT